MLVRFGARLRSARKAKGMSQEALSLASGFSRNTISDIELGKVNSSLESVLRLATAINITMAELMPDYPS